VRDSKVLQLTEDHTLINYKLKQGQITKEEARTMKGKNVITRAVGHKDYVEVDTSEIDVQPGDRFMLCSDGLHRYLPAEEVVASICGAEPAEIAQALISMANDRGGADNITAVVVDVSQVPEADGEAERKAEIFRGMPLFRYLTYRELMQVLGATTMRHFPAGQTIFSEGSMGYELFVILAGRVLLKKGDTKLAELEPGGHFGEMALVDQDRRSATAIATEEARLLVLSRRKFYQLLRKEPTLAVKLLWNFLQVLSGRLRQANESLRQQRESLGAEVTHPNPLDTLDHS
jgi:hypothetical protein